MANAKHPIPTVTGGPPLRLPQPSPSSAIALTFLDLEILLLLSVAGELTTSRISGFVSIPSSRAYGRCRRLQEGLGFVSSRPGPALLFFYPTGEVVTAANRDRIMKWVEARKERDLDPGLRALATRQRLWKLEAPGRRHLRELQELLCASGAVREAATVH